MRQTTRPIRLLTVGLMFMLTIASLNARAGEPEPSTTPITAEQVALDQLADSLATATDDELTALRPSILKHGMAAHDLLYAGTDATAAERAAIRAELRANRDKAARDTGLVVHEWGSVMTLAGHDGATIGYLGDDQSDLPGFVHTWTSILQDQPMVIRKPILYFYPKDDTQQLGTVQIVAPKGLITQWYPKAASIQPRFFGQLPEHVPVENGRIIWSGITASYDKDGKVPLPPIANNHPWWHIVRDVDAAKLSTHGENEKFLFYRGLHQLGATVHVTGSETDGAYTLQNNGKHTVRRPIFMHIDHGAAKFYEVPTLEPEAKHVLNLGDASTLTTEQATARFVEQLEAEGLFPKEADVIRRIWGKFFFNRDGIRLLYIMPEPRADEMLNLVINPKPADVVRTLIVQVECPTAEMIQRIEELIADLGHSDFATRERAHAQLKSLDRFAEALLRQAVKDAEDPEVRNRARKILDEMDKKKLRP